MDAGRANLTQAYLDDLAAARTAKERYRGTCVDCGCQTSWGGGSRPKASPRCRFCHLIRVAAQHGTRSKYSAGCRCDACRQATAAAMREYKRKRRALAGKP